MNYPADYDAAITLAMKTMPAGPSLNLTVEALRVGRAKAMKKLERQIASGR